MKTQELSIRAAAKEYNVNYSKLGHRSLGREAMVKGNAGRRKFEPAEEEYLKSYLVKAASLNRRYSKVEVIQLASAIYQNKMPDSEVTVGRSWFKNFMTRYPDLRLIVGQNLGAKRFAAQSTELIERWIALFAAHIAQFNIHHSDVYNFDEIAFQIGEATQSRVLTSTEIRHSSQKQIFDNSDWVSAFECINTAGEALPPYILFKGESISRCWIEDLPLHADWRYDCSPTGWTNDQVGLNWLEKMFIPHVASNRHGDRLMSFALSNWKTCGDKRTRPFKDASAPITNNQFIRHYQAARQGAFTPEVILGSFAKAGLQPLDAQRVIDNVTRNPPTATVENTSQFCKETRDANTSRSSKSRNEANTSRSLESRNEASISESSDYHTQSSASESSDTEPLDNVSSIVKAMRRAKFKATSSAEDTFLGQLEDAFCRITTTNSLRIKDLLAENLALRQKLAAKKRPKRKYAEESGGIQQEFAEGQEKRTKKAS
ncbi:hypothetical protein JCM33374_g5318 [Metschnikowia sp. JCM 33374]|nr:hypothetical protein JCM33374_g5318 [Metschnikowia sp. JCM 33374]